MAAAGDRRALLRLAMAAALAPAFASRALGAAPNARFAPPKGLMRYTRRLERSLPGSNKLVVSRSFAVSFAPTASGWSVTGEQVAVSVDAPPRIAQLAELERRRKETGLFPLQLDSNGRIVDGPDPQPSQEVEQAVAIVRQELARISLTADDRHEFDAFVRAVHEAGARMTSAMPHDLFAPAGDATRAEREVTLPDGEVGTIEVAFTASTDPETGLMRRARRDIVTTIAADSRLTREDWTLVPL